jgi:hypothetical protein
MIRLAQTRLRRSIKLRTWDGLEAIDRCLGVFQIVQKPRVCAAHPGLQRIDGTHRRMNGSIPAGASHGLAPGELGAVRLQ